MTDEAGRELTPLVEHNREALERWRKYASRGNGLTCPACGAELLDAGDGAVRLVGSAAKNECFPGKLVSCKACGFEGYRYM